MEAPKTCYARSGEVSIAYQISGEGPFELVWTPEAFSNLDLAWEDDAQSRFFGRLAGDRVAGIADLETRMDDIRAVMDAGGSESAAVVGVSEGGPMALVFAATWPRRRPGRECVSLDTVIV